MTTKVTVTNDPSVSSKDHVVVVERTGPSTTTAPVRLRPGESHDFTLSRGDGLKVNEAPSAEG